MSDFKAKIHQIRFRTPYPAGGAYSAPPDSLAGFNGPTSNGREGRGRQGKGREVEGREGKKGRGRGRSAIQFLASGRHRLSYATDRCCCGEPHDHGWSQLFNSLVCHYLSVTRFCTPKSNKLNFRQSPHKQISQILTYLRQTDTRTIYQLAAVIGIVQL